jgi:hypothetical protein
MSAFSAPSAASFFLAGEDLSATLPDLWWREACLARLWCLTGSAAGPSGSAFADCESACAATPLSSAPAAAGNGLAKHTKSPVASIHTESNDKRPLALMVI